MFHPELHVLIVLIATCLSVFFNGVLLIVIVFRSSPSIGRYRFLLMIFAVFNIMYSLVHFVLQPVIHVHDMSFMEMSTAGSYSIMWNRIASAFFSSCFAQSLVLFAFHYFYRYVFTVRSEYEWIFRTKKSILVMIALYFFVAIDYGYVSFHNFGKTPEKDAYWAEEIYNSYGKNISDLGYIAAIYYVDGSIQWTDLIGLANVSMVIGSTMAILLFCAIRVYKTVGKVVIRSGMLKNQQTQLFRVLVMQTFFSMVFSFIPSSFILASAFILGRTVGSHANIVSVILTVFSVIDPLLLLYFVGCYRKAVHSFLVCQLANQVTAVTSLSLPSDYKGSQIHTEKMFQKR